VPALEEYKDRLAEFMKLNSNSQIEEIEIGGAKHIVVAKPWNEDTFAIVIDGENEELLESLNKIYLPERFSAIWHADEEAAEFIWTTFPTKNIKSRNFTFVFDGIEYSCRYGEASKRLLAIANNAVFLKPSTTDHRKLWQFGLEQHLGPEDRAKFEPHCFWISPIKWDEDLILSLAGHLNFYMSYYDMGSPLVLVHTPKSEERAVKPRTRYLNGEFPSRIDGRKLDENLLHFWRASLEGDAARRFLYYHRIIEYAAASYLDAKVRSSVRRILAAPAISHKVNETAEKLVSLIAGVSKQDNEVPKIQGLLQDLVEQDMVWNEVNRNIEAFSSETIFEGGFKIPPLLNGNDKRGAFATAWPVAFYGTVRNIRNALSHGKDFKTQGVIPPTTRNLDLLRPWVAPLSVIAAQVVVCQGIV
jgi:hypothetical protein